MYSYVSNNDIQFKVNITKRYKIKNRKKYKGKDEYVEYNNEYEHEYMRRLDLNDNVILWSYKKTKIKYRDTYNNVDHIFYPSFYVMSLDDDIKKVPKDKPYNEYIIHFLTETEYNEFILKDEDTLSTMNPHEREFYNYNLIIQHYNFMRYKAAEEYCKKNGMDFLLVHPNGGISKVSIPYKYN